jgi:hypothetical protein
MRHFCANFYRACKSKELPDDLQDYFLAYFERRFAFLYNRLLRNKSISTGGYEFLDRHLIFRPKWKRAYDEDGRRYGQMTSNMVACFNNVLKGVCALPVTAMFDTPLRSRMSISRITPKRRRRKLLEIASTH